MLALRKTDAAFGAALTHIPEPAAPPPGWALVAVRAAGICGSDVHAFEWTAGYGFMAGRLPLTLGHEFSGTVLATGPGAGVKPGDAVVCWPTVGCGRCAPCAADRRQDCQQRRIVGLHMDGAFAERVLVPAANLRHAPEGCPAELAALAEPLAVAINAVDLAGIAPGDAVVVLGPGPIGLAAAFAATQAGAEVAVFGRDDAPRLACARDMGAAHAVDLLDESLDNAVGRIFGRPADRVIEAAGVPEAVAAGLGVLRSNGVMVVAGIHARPLKLDLTGLVRMKQQLRGAHDTTEAALTRALAMLRDHPGPLSRLITHRLPLSKALDAFDLARGRRAVKVMLTPDAGAGA
ncbi:MAG: zinc-binding dehydrogenase [Rubrimonas sp.]